jgi:hypothetical protein
MQYKAIHKILPVLLLAQGQVQDDPNSQLVPPDSTEMDIMLIQIAAGAGQSVRNGTDILFAGWTNRTANNDAAYNFLISSSRRWTIVINTTNR